MGIFDSFIGDFARREKHRTALTYHRLLGQFERWVQEVSRHDTFDRENVLKFLEGQKWSNASKNCFLAALRGWAKDAKSKIPSGTTLEEIQQGRDAEKRLDRIIALKDYTVRREKKPALSLEQISDLFSVMDPDTSSVFWVLLWFNFRVGELKLIKTIDWERGRLEVENEKVGGTRILFFDEYTARILRHASDKGLLDLPEIKIWKMFRKYSGFVAPNKLTPHTCRHTFNTHMRNILKDDGLLRTLMGHGNRSMTDVYDSTFEEEIREAMVEKNYLKPLEVVADEA